jgi:hypothetical protein
MDLASKTDLTSAEDLAAFKAKLVKWALALDLASAVVYWLSPLGTPSAVTTPTLLVDPSQAPTPA